MQRVPRCMNVSWPPCCLLPSAQTQPSLLLPEEAPTPLPIALTYTELPSSSAISGEGVHIRQLFCLDDSIIPFSGISISIIILIIAFDPKNYQTSLKLMPISLSAANSWAFKKIRLHCITLNHAAELEKINWKYLTYNTPKPSTYKFEVSHFIRGQSSPASPHWYYGNLHLFMIQSFSNTLLSVSTFSVSEDQCDIYLSEKG